ncbi:MAG TPA: lipocalin family protein [Flavobacteriaceae bacterium]|nr:lipocalin family protein [Flavobacteriaceae bacterium]
MKNSIKKLLLLLLVSFCFSCSNDEDIAPAVNFEEKIIGTWQLMGREPNGIEVCELDNIIRFSENGELFVKVFIGDTPGNCQSASRSGTWSYQGNNFIEVDLTGVEENALVNILFFDNYTAFKLIQENAEEGHYETYIKQ